jgi:hypothetical protein
LQATQDRIVVLTESNTPASNRSGFEVASWDGARWLVEGIYETGAEAASEAKALLSRRPGVRVTQEVFNAQDGTFKSRVVFSEFRDSARGEGAMRAERAERRRAPAEVPVAPAAAPRISLMALLKNIDAPLYVSIASLTLSAAALLVAVFRG